MEFFYSLFLVLIVAGPTCAADYTAQQQSLHVLNRIAYSPGPGDVARVAHRWA